MDTHDQAVAAISTQITHFCQTRTPFRIYHGSTNSTKNHKVDPTRMVDTSNLNHVLQVDTASETCLVEPNVPMDQLVDATIPHGLVPKVVMEFPGITAGGGFAGTAGESSGFKYGFFDDTVNWIEIVVATGEVVRASREERSDLFHGAAGGFGTLGVTTLLELQLIEAKAFVELTYHPTRSPGEAIEKLKEVCSSGLYDYVDGILFAPTHGAVITGRLTATLRPNTKLQPFSRPQDPWHYLHVERSTAHAPHPVTVATPLRDYLFRYDRGAFWTGKYAFAYFLTPFNRLTRYLLDAFLHTRVMYHALHASGHAKKYIIQDLLIPSSHAETFIDFVAQTFGFWPLWLCPFRLPAGKEISLHPRLPPLSEAERAAGGRDFVNVGVWGPGSRSYAEFVRQNRLLEARVRELGGVKWLYAQAYYTEAEMWEVYDRGWYEGLRGKYGAGYLPSVYEKVRVDLSAAAAGREESGWAAWVRGWAWDVWPVSGVYGVLKTMWETEYLVKR
ncbi:FAD-binding domain-containing protein [Teratosphaeria nubilosa]|uniref:Delta(24)-sterol reductase n=1 Tax=Teratosphaeria nubilosa TaxID=161662 RepID=A0A6G1KWS0_9PEZI|nr:FAD-binding domain-containing protein [Teratosphaeria nubilosa]